MRYFKFLLVFSSLFVVSCSSKDTGSASSSLVDDASSNMSDTSEDQSYFSRYHNDKYVVAKRIFDLDYINSKTIEESFAIEELPGIVFEYQKDESNFVVNFDENVSISFNYALYIADVNNDSHYDVCYSCIEGSGALSYKVGVFDCYNKKTLFLSNGSPTANCVFDLDDNNLLVLEEFDRASGTKNLLKQSKRILLTGKEGIEFEPFDFDTKIKGISCGFSPAGDDIKIGNTLSINLFIKYLSKNVDTCPIQNKDISIDCDDKTLTYLVKNQEGTASYLPDFYIEFSFSTEGIKKVSVNIGQFVSNGTIRVYS